ncbi:transcription factor S [Candidatus Geothermarchaeota archaeon ex4572_27]|nr:MAG: transcription factor S [Candidatus Geothermarchaeota archaeon ex4572_27]
MGDLPLCPKCGRLMSPVREEGRVKLTCRSCGYVAEPTAQPSTQLTQRIVHRPQERLTVIEQEAPKTMPTIKALCPKCGHNEAYWWLVQTRRADEGSTRFYRCVKCNYTWREYD